MADKLNDEPATTAGHTIGFYAIPAALGVVLLALGRTHLWTWEPVSPAALLPAAALITSGLFGLLTLLFGRLKDLTQEEPPEAGPDPVAAASEVFKWALNSVRASVLLCAVLLLGVVLPAALSDVASSMSFAVIVHLGARLIVILNMLSGQATQAAGNRATTSGVGYFRH